MEDKQVFGWSGKVLRVDLTTGSITDEPTLPKYQPFVGGAGIGYKVIWDEVPPEADAFDPSNRIVFGVGPLTATEAPGSARVVVVSKSPHVYEDKAPKRSLTTHSSIGGSWAVNLKLAGFDAVVIYGKAEKPVYLWIHDGKAEIKDASGLWGQDTFATKDKIIQELATTGVEVAAIGQAGENLVRFTPIISPSGNAAGQGGFGAVMGSKNLKAIAVSGKGTIKVARPKEFRDDVVYTHSLMTQMYMNPKSLPWTAGVDPYATSITDMWKRQDIGMFCAPELNSKYRVGKEGCAGCPVRCYDVVDVPGIGKGSMHCVQYFYAFTGKDGEETYFAKDLADKYCINAYELFLMIPWLLSLNDKGILTEKDLPFSAYPGKEFISTLLHKIAFREGIGDVLAEGVARASERLKVYDDLLKEEYAQYLPGPAEFSVAWSSYGGHGFCGHYDGRNWLVDGMLWAMHSRDPHDHAHGNIGLTFWSNLLVEESKKIASIVYGSPDAVSSIGNIQYNEAEVRASIYAEHRAELKDALTLCDWIFPLYVSPYADRKPPYIGDTSIENRLFSTATGVTTSEQELLKMGECINNLARAIMVREMGLRDIRNAHDVLPEHFFVNRNPIGGAPPVDRENFEKAKDTYYRLRGWDVGTGLPTRLKLEQLGLKDVADELEKLNLLV